MSRRTTIALAATAAALLAFIFLYERHTLTSRDVAGRRDRLIERFVRDQVSRVEIERGGKRTVLVHERDEDDEDAFGEWKLVEPVKAAADEDAVESLLGTLEWASARRTIQGVDDADRKRFGLLEPTLQAWITVKRERLSVAVGKEDPTDGGRYVQLGDPTVAYVVGKDVTEALDHDAGHFRHKALFEERDAGEAVALSVSGDGGRRAVELREQRWWLVRPFEAWADNAQVDAALDSFLGLKATRYVADEPKSLDAYGLETPSLHVQVRGADGDETWKLELRVGSPCAEGDGEVHARAGGGPVVCVRGSDVEPLRKPADALRDPRLVSLGEAEVASVSLQLGGAKLVVEEDDGALRYRAGKREGEVDRGALGDWLRELRRAEVAEIQPLGDDGGQARGLTRPRARLTVASAAGPETLLLLGARTEEGVWVRRGDEPFALRVPQSVEEAFDPSPVRFRSRLLVEEQDEAATRVMVERAGVTERVDRSDGAWRVEAPVQMPADRIATRALVSRLARLEADRFVSERPAPAHGLGAPRWVVTIRFDGSASEDGQEGKGATGDARERVLRVGADAEGGAFAQLGSDPAVFVLPAAVVDAVREPLVDRGLLAVPRSDLTRVRIERGGKALELVRDGSEWKRPDGGAADPERVRRLLDRVAALRASGVTDYGAAPAAHGLAKPRTRVILGRAEAEQVTFLVGAVEGEGPEAVTHVRREDLDVGFTFPAGVMDTFVTFEP
jgi:hypothetical protein